MVSGHVIVTVDTIILCREVVSFKCTDLASIMCYIVLHDVQWMLYAMPRSGELRTQKLKSNLVRTQSSKVFPLKPGVGQYIYYSHTCLAYCQGFLPCLFLPFRYIHLHFFSNLSRFFLCWLWLTHGSCVGPQDKICHPTGCRFPC